MPLDSVLHRKTASAIGQAWTAAAVQPGDRVLRRADGGAGSFMPRGNHCSLAKILSIASAPVVITGRIWWR